MAITRSQNPTSEQQQQSQQQQPQRTSEQQRSLARRQDYYPARDFFALSPLSMMRRLTEEMDRSFSSTFGLTRGLGESGIWSPPIEVRERNGNLEIIAELPGMTKDDVKVEFTDEGIVIEGEKRREQETEEGGVHRSERTYGYFYRLIPLAEGAEPDKARAEFKDGVLHVQVPVTERRQQRVRQIPINS
jgi:HSP20 family protein